jgi:hypothetical protein
MPYQPYDTGWIKTLYSTVCPGWFLLSTGLLPRFMLYSLYNNIYNPFATMVSAICDFIGRIGISTGIRTIQFESLIFNKFDYVQPIYNVIKYIESLVPNITSTTPSSLHYGSSNIPHRKSSTGKHLASYYVRKRLLHKRQVISYITNTNNCYHDGTNKNKKRKLDFLPNATGYNDCIFHVIIWISAFVP